MNTPSQRPKCLWWLPALQEPEQAREWTLAQWAHVVRVARRQRLLARLAEAIERQGLSSLVPGPVVKHLQAEQAQSRWRSRAMDWALSGIGETLSDTPYPRVLLKGAAYRGQQLELGAGRLPSDVDIMVPKSAIADAQTRLEHAGWRAVPLDEHDQRYYHEWSHEVPPMRHPVHRVELDLHHGILPPVARTHVDSSLLFETLVDSAWPGWKVLAPHDQVLHSASHLFHDSEIRLRLRDLVDLDALLRHFGSHVGFWLTLTERAQQLGLDESLALAFHFCSAWLQTPIPTQALDIAARRGPSPLKRAWLVPLIATLLLPDDPDDEPALRQDLAASIFLARYHRNRMPLRLLVPHLWHKLRPQSLTAETAPRHAA